MSRRRRRASGFTLIELMLVVVMIGILSSVALPTLSRISVRSRTAERSMALTSLKAAAEDLYARNGKLPNGGGGMSWLIANWNPASPAPWSPTWPTGTGSTKRRFDSAAPDWRNLSVQFDGAMYYSYYVLAVEPALGGGTLFIRADGDVDGDGTVSQKQRSYSRTTGGYQLVFEWPAYGSEDSVSF